MRVLHFVFLIVLSLFLASASAGQVATGGQFELKQVVIAGGGGNASGGSFAMSVSIAEPAAGANSSGLLFRVRAGFLQDEPFAPTSAGVSVSGRLITSDGLGVGNTAVFLSDMSGVRLRTISTSLGYYRFDDIPAGQTYLIEVPAKQLTFTPRLINVFDDNLNFDIVAEPTGN
ncbi:MAG TPA: carboxypeptidase-like regulatory domain-containing protein [Pyrinomonadaceae bacterium]|nr:carboxypeptidase-like regulatory domain-containing protein [Pyrinomonadaceae bacterium]